MKPPSGRTAFEAFEGGFDHGFSFDDLREKVTDLAQSGVAKSKQLAEIAKLKTSNMGEEDTIKKAYLELGRLYYAERAPPGRGLCRRLRTDQPG